MTRPRPADILLGALALLLLSSTVGLARNHFSSQPLPLLQAWRPPPPMWVSEVTLENAQRLLEAGALFVDARERERYDAGHVAGAMNLPVDEFEDMSPGRVRDNIVYTLRVTPAVVVYCDGPECQASDRLAKLLTDSGLRNVRVMPEGWPGWEAAGYPSVVVP